MKTIFIEGKSKKSVKLPIELIERLPGRIMLFTTIQFIESIESIKESLEKKGKEVILHKGLHSAYEGQLLGCDVKRLDSTRYDAFLYIGTGLFHPKALILKNEKKVFCIDPFSKKWSVLDEKDVADMKKKLHGALLKFLNSKEVGVIISTKPGQSRLKDALSLEKKYPDKNFYMMLSNTIDFNDLENFPFIDCFINTACPRIGYDDSIRIGKPVLNINDLDDLK